MEEKSHQHKYMHDEYANFIVCYFRDYIQFLHKENHEDWTPKNLIFNTHLNFNAYVEMQPDRAALACFYDGCSLCLWDLIASLVIDNKFMTDIPRAFCSMTEGTDVARRFWDYSWLKKNQQGIPQRFEPALRYHFHDDDSIHILTHLLELTIKFVFYHEYAHVHLGHLNELEKSGGFQFEEVSVAPPIENPQSLRKWVLDADLLALGRLLIAGRNLEHRKSAHIICKSTAEWDSIVLLACSIVFSIVQLAEVGLGKDTTQRTHPSAAARMLNTIISYVDIIHNGLLGYEETSEEQLFRYVWQYFLSNLVPLSNRTGILPVTYDDLKNTIFMNNESSPETDTVAEWLECKGLTAVPKTSPYALIYVPVDFFTKSSEHHPE